MSPIALIITDMIKDFLDPGGALYMGEAGRQIIPFVSQKLAAMRQQGAVIIFLCDSHAEDDREFARFPPHAIKGTVGVELIPPLEQRPGEYRVDKTHFSGLYGTELEEVLQKERVTEVHLVGVCTSICVMETSRDLNDRDYALVVYRQGVADLDPQEHEWALKRMTKLLGAQVV
jgi:nicotinamidase-related amidase